MCVSSAPFPDAGVKTIAASSCHIYPVYLSFLMLLSSAESAVLYYFSFWPQTTEFSSIFICIFIFSLFGLGPGRET